jgi:hypothetical protein
MNLLVYEGAQTALARPGIPRRVCAETPRPSASRSTDAHAN